MQKYSIRLGYACVNTELKKYSIITSRSARISTVNKKGFEYIKDLVEENIDDLFKILIYNEAHGIRFYRISSDIFPHINNQKFGYQINYSIDFVKKKIKKIGKYAKDNGHRLTMHPGQHIQLASPNKDVVVQSLIELEFHAYFLQMLDYHPEDGSVIVIHGGGKYDDKKKSLERWKCSFSKLSPMARSYVCLENDENNYGVLDLLPLCETLNIPFCLDIFHNDISSDKVKIDKTILKRILKTWENRNIIPKIHISSQQPGSKRGRHSDTLDKIPSYILKIPKIFKTPLDIMFEVKDKERSVLKMYYKYFDKIMDSKGKISYILKKE